MMKLRFYFEYTKRIKLFSTLLAGLILALSHSGCTESDDSNQVTPVDSAATNEDSSIGKKDAATYMDGGADAKLDTGANRDTGTNSDAHTSCCGDLCTRGIAVYDDAGVNEYIKERFGDSESAISRLYKFCSNKYVNCEKYKIDIRSSDFIPQPSVWPLDEKRGVHSFALVDKDHILFIWPEGEKLTAYFDAGAMTGTGWKIEITGASIVYETTPCPPATVRGPGIDLEGSLDMVKFVRDLSNTLPDYVVLKDSNGKVVLDTRN